MQEYEMTDLTEIFARDPLSYTKENGELVAIIAEMRAKRAQFNMGNLNAGSTKLPTAKQQQILSLKDSLKLDLDL
jgi:hypothetical protein